MDQETLYQLIYDEQWLAVLDAIHHHHTAIASEPLLTRATDTFLTVFFGWLDEGSPTAFSDELEKLFLLHTGHFYPLSKDRFEKVIEALIAIHAERPDVAVGYARFCPDNAHCAVLLDSYQASQPEPLIHTQQATLDLTSNTPLPDVNHTISLFKSQQEVEFFLAVREVYATYFVYPNVALSCLIDYEAIKEQLSSEARTYFFRALIDCVVFDQHDGYRPLYFFELDSDLHDTEERQAKDRLKEQILALAGQTLYRIRKRRADQGRAAFVSLLKELTEI